MGGSLGLAGGLAPVDGADERALLWRVLVWDLGFVVLGEALTGAIVSCRRNRLDDGRAVALEAHGRLDPGR